ncbi:MAG: phosphoadenosine phosphosulfate reductase family protein, partial [Endomicrobia bacterium]|nr:phosphoadenosine phosphosulfate reductase family protein [Endomicrobiia bacterium]
EILRHNCNVFDCKRPRSRPLAFWTEKDIWDYINKYNVKISDIYYKGHTRTGCMFCGFGLQFLNKDGKNKYELMLEQYPQIANYFYETLGFKKVLEY